MGQWCEMRKTALLWLSLKEFKNSVWLFVLSAILLATIFSAGFFISSASTNMMQVFYDYANTMSPEESGFLITLAGLRYSSAQLVDDLPFSRIYPEFFGSVDVSDFSFEGRSLPDCNIYAEYVSSGSRESNQGIDFLEKHNHSNYAWISESVATASGFRIGDRLVYRSGTEFELAYDIVGLYDEDVSNYDVMIPFATYYQSEISAGRNVDHEVYGVLTDSRDYSAVCNELRERNISPYSILDESFKSLSLIHALFQIVFLGIVIAGVWTFSNICGVIIESRFKFILKMRVLGMRTAWIASVYAIIIGTLTGTSIVVVYFLNRYFSGYVQALATDMFPGVKSSSGSVHYQFAVALLLSAAILGKSVYGLVRKVNALDLIGMLEEKNNK